MSKDIITWIVSVIMKMMELRYESVRRPTDKNRYSGNESQDRAGKNVKRG